MKFARKLKDESGQATIVTLLCMTCLLGFVGFAADVGTLLRAKRNMQIAADSAAIAGAAELTYGDMTTAADAAAAQNGVVVGVNGGTVIVNSPPKAGPYAGLTGGYVEAIVSQSEPTFFMKIFHFSSMTVAARAVAYAGGVSNDCVYVLNPTASEAMWMKGSFDVSAPKCGVIVNSNNSCAMEFTGGGGSLTAGSIGVAGGDCGQTGDSTPAPVTQVAQVSDPLGSMTTPTPTGCTTITATMTGTLSPGCYSAPTGKKGALGTVAISNATLGSGTYVFEGNVVLSGSVTSGAGGTTLDMYNGALSENTGAALNLVAPSPCPTGTLPPCGGLYGGIAIMQPASNTNMLLFDFGSSSGKIDGIIYAPNAELELHDSGGDKSGGLQLITDLIVGTLYDQTATLSIQSYSQTEGYSPLTKVALVE